MLTERLLHSNRTRNRRLRAVCPRTPSGFQHELASAVGKVELETQCTPGGAGCIVAQRRSEKKSRM